MLSPDPATTPDGAPRARDEAREIAADARQNQAQANRRRAQDLGEHAARRAAPRGLTGCPCGCLSTAYFDDPECKRHIADHGEYYRRRIDVAQRIPDGRAYGTPA